MALPASLPTRRVSFGAAVIFEDGTPLAMTIEISASTSLVWGPTGTPLISYTRSWVGTVGTERVMPLPVTDVVGYRTTMGEAVDVSDGKQSHSYSGRISYRLGNAEIKRAEFGPFILPSGDGSIVDIDLLIPVTGPTGITISLPDSWSAGVDEAQAAAVAAQAAAVAAQEAAEQAEGTPGPEGPEGPAGPASTVPGPPGDTGPQGVSVQSIALFGTVGRVKTYRITLTNGTTFNFDVTDGLNGTNGTNGTNGRSITSVARTSGTGAAGTTDTYTITYSDATTSTYQVVNGANGTNGTNGVDAYPIVVAPEGTVSPGTLANGTLLMEY